VHSARWAAMHDAGEGDADNNRLLLRQLEAVEDAKRTARFVCALALCDAQGRVVLTAHGTVEGRILREPRGSNGFGYDPLFLIDALGRTAAELPPAEKHAISHRGQALKRLRGLMQSIPELRGA
jgi:XTP/dITP diphosphohydrolase